VTLAIAALSLLIFALFFLPSVRGWINQWPLLWRILYPALAVVSGVMLVRAVQTSEGWFVMLKWALLLVAGVTGSVTFLGGPLSFLQVGKGFAIAFVVAEVLDTIRAAFSGD
jgi:hypothetical protein